MHQVPAVYTWQAPRLAEDDDRVLGDDLVRYKVALMVSSPSPSLNHNMTLLISFCKAERSSGACGSLESTEPIVPRRGVAAPRRGKTSARRRRCVKQTLLGRGRAAQPNNDACSEHHVGARP